MTKNDSLNIIAELYEKYYPLFHKIASTFTNNKSEMEDVLHDAFVKVLVKKDRIAELKDNERVSYICTVIANTGRDYLKKKIKYTYDVLTEEIADEINVSPEQIILVNEDKELSIRCFHKLKSEDRALLQLYYFEEYEPEQIASRIGIKKKYIHQYIYRAKKRLIKLIWEEMKSDEKE